MTSGYSLMLGHPSILVDRTCQVLVSDNPYCWKTIGGIFSSKKRVVLKKNRPLHDLKILVVEDTLDLQVLLQQMISLSGGDVYICGNGMEALEALQQTGAHFDIVLMDLQMPVLNGFETLKRMASMELDVPVVALSAHFLTDDKAQNIGKGFDSFLQKPFAQQNLIDVILLTVEKKGLRENKITSTSKPDVFDSEFREAYLVFYDCLQEYVSQLNISYAQCDWETVKKISHKIKGTSGCYGYKLLSQKADLLHNEASSKRPNRGKVQYCIDGLMEDFRSVQSDFMANHKIQKK